MLIQLLVHFRLLSLFEKGRNFISGVMRFKNHLNELYQFGKNATLDVSRDSKKGADLAIICHF